MSRMWWIGGGALVLAALAVGCLRAGEADVEIDVSVGRYHYEPGSDAPISVPVGSTVLLHLHSEDVTHGFAIEGHSVNVEVPAGGSVDVRFTVSRVGDFAIYCTVFCGSGHPQHKGTLHVA